jgi:hypothetical protein
MGPDMDWRETWRQWWRRHVVDDDPMDDERLYWQERQRVTPPGSPSPSKSPESPS